MQISSRFRISLRMVPYAMLGVVGFLSTLPLPGIDTQPARAWKAYRKPVPPAPKKAEPLCRAGELPRIPKANKARYYRELLALHGSPSSKITVLALRGLSPDGQRHSSSDNVGPYNDTLVLLKGEQVVEFRGSTHAGQESSSLSPNGVAQIRPGTYRAFPAGDFHEMPCWEMQTLDGDLNIPSWRDVDADGTISRTEKANAERNAVTADGILLHNGRFDDHGSSIGCQTLPPATMEQFIELTGENSEFVYTLVDANVPNPPL